ncbi:hypothetical protein RHIZO_05271 [Rhizobiaceae bacterium]|nr:hypothetical protein RHIZO_05271 [Rhizobiaceae bacterium]
MKRLQAYKFELQPNGEQVRQMRRFAGACRFVYNKALALQKDNHAAGGKFIGYVAMAKHLTAWRNSAETPWLAEAPVHPQQQALKDLERAYKNFFAQRAAFPQFRKKGQSERFRYPDPKQIRLDQANGRIFLPKLGWLRLRKSREAVGELRSVTVWESCGKWFVSIQTRRDVDVPLPKGGAVGLDLGIARFATLSDGTFFAPANSFKAHEARLARAQRSLSRKVKFSNNWKKAKARIQRIHARIGNVRRDYLHKTSTAISQNHAMVCIENLQVRNMSRSARGSIEVPGKKVRQKAGLNKAILDQGWGEFRRQLGYKLDWSGGMLIAVPPHNTSRTCPCCGHISAENRPSQARFSCTACDYENHADLVGAINILRAGHARLACGDTSPEVGASAQEPAEATTPELLHA